MSGVFKKQDVSSLNLVLLKELLAFRAQQQCVLCFTGGSLSSSARGFIFVLL